MSEHNLIQSMTNEELRREIAEALGYTEESHPKWDGWSRIIDPSGKPVREDRNRDGWTKYPWSYDCYFPDWPQDDGAAFRLVIDVLDRLNNTRHKPVWELRVSAKSVFYARLWIGEPQEAIGDSRTWNEVDARALSELAALALRRLSDG